MKVLNQNASATLYEKAKSLDEHHDSWRCVYINLSDREEQYNRSLRTHFIINAITGLLTDMDGYIYLCEDGDIVILFQGALKPVVSKLASHFEELDSEEPAEHPGNDMFTIFDLSKSWRVFFYLCRAKYLRSLPVAERTPASLMYYNSAARRPMAMPQE